MKALFLDRDGVINERLVDAYVERPEQFRLIPGIIPIVKLARAKNYEIVIISNQQGVGKGLMALDDLHEVHRYMNDLLAQEGIDPISKIHVCTSLRSANDPRRKPEPGMLLEAIFDYELAPQQCVFLGDMSSDAAAGAAAGVRTALVGDYSKSDADIVAPDHEKMLAELKKVL